MNDDIDQFGRNKSQSQNINLDEDKSKKILESLSVIKKQLQNKNFTPEIEQSSKINNDKSNNKSQINSNFEELNLKILKLEERLITLNELLQNDINQKLSSKSSSQEKEIEGSFFHNFNNNLNHNKSNSLLVIKKDNINNSKIRFYHFISIFLFLIIVLMFLVSFKLKVPISEIINIFI